MEWNEKHWIKITFTMYQKWNWIHLTFSLRSYHIGYRLPCILSRIQMPLSSCLSLPCAERESSTLPPSLPSRHTSARQPELRTETSVGSVYQGIKWVSLTSQNISKQQTTQCSTQSRVKNLRLFMGYSNILGLKFLSLVFQSWLVVHLTTAATMSSNTNGKGERSS